MSITAPAEPETDTPELDEEDVLELSTIRPKRRRVTIPTEANPEGKRPDGSYYEALNPEELGLLDLQQLGRDWADIETLWKNATKAKVKELERKLDEMVIKLIDGATLTDIAHLPVLTKRAVAMRFFGALNARQFAALDAKSMAQMAQLGARVQAA